MKTIRVEVTPHCIGNGIQDSCTLCPISLGIRAVVDRDLPSGFFEVMGEFVRFVDRGSSPNYWSWVSVQIPLPPRAIAFIKAFDSGPREILGPFSFAIDIPDWVPLREPSA
jgi:hypothetical protein